MLKPWNEYENRVQTIIAPLMWEQSVRPTAVGVGEMMSEKAGCWKGIAMELHREGLEAERRVRVLEARLATLTGIRDEFEDAPRLTDDDVIDLTDERFAEDARAFYSRAVREGGRG